MADYTNLIARLKAEVLAGAPEVTTLADVQGAEQVLEETERYGDLPRAEVARYRLELYRSRMPVVEEPVVEEPVVEEEISEEALDAVDGPVLE